MLLFPFCSFFCKESYQDFAVKYSIANLPADTLPQTRYSIESKYFRNQRNFYIDIFAVVVAFLVQRLAAMATAYYSVTDTVVKTTTTTATVSSPTVVNASASTTNPTKSKKDE